MIVERIAVTLCVVTSLMATAIIGQNAPALVPPTEVETTESHTAETILTEVEETTEPTEETVPTTESPVIPETEPTEETTIVEEPPYTADELEMLALVIYQEAGGDACSDETRLMVGTVVMNRVADSRFPDTLYGVLTQRGQYGRFHWTGLVWPARANDPSEIHAVERAYACAEHILLGERVLPSDVIWQAEFIQGTEVVAHQDGIYFCR